MRDKDLKTFVEQTEDTLTIPTSPEKNISTKREALSELAKVYDPFGLVSPSTLSAKMLYRGMCEAKLPWDGELNERFKQRWKLERMGSAHINLYISTSTYHNHTSHLSFIVV